MTDAIDKTTTVDGAARLSDRFGRRMRYLRVSLTDRCNLRCTYCRPETFAARRHEDLLSYEEIALVARVAARLGMSKVRLTGGEPLVRKGAPGLVAMLKGIDGIEEIAMTTNAVLLARFASELAAAGLDRVNVSLDTLRPERFKALTSGGELAAVIGGIDAALEAGLAPLKTNTVMMRGFNEDEFADIMDFASARGITARFIECMPMRDDFQWRSRYISTDEVLAIPAVAERVVGEAGRAGASRGAGGPSLYLPLRAGGEAGFITPMSHRFCSACDRLRLTSDGRLRSCLPSDADLDLRAAVRSGGGEAAVEALLKRAVDIKPETGTYSFEMKGRQRSMVEIGG